MEAALDYMGLKPGEPIMGTKVDWVFIGSCTNSRISDLRAAAAVARGRKVAPGVRAWVVPGSETVKRDAVAEGLDRIFLDAGFEWREPGCSMCLAANGETVPPRPALGLDLQPQLRRAAGAAGAHASRQPRHGRGRGDRRGHHRRAPDGELSHGQVCDARIRWPRRSCARTSTPT